MRIFLSGLYLSFVIALMIAMPFILIPLFQDLGLGQRDVIGLATLTEFIVLLLLLLFGTILWMETQ